MFNADDGYEAFILCLVAILGVILEQITHLAMLNFFKMLPRKAMEKLQQRESIREFLSSSPQALKRAGKGMLFGLLAILAKIWFLVLAWEASRPVTTAIVVMYTFNVALGLGLRIAHSPSPPVGK